MAKPGYFNANDHQVKIETPIGEAIWASLSTPKKWNDTDTGNYQISLVLSKEDAQPLIDSCNKLKEEMVTFIADQVNDPKIAPHNPWKENEDGHIEFRFKKPHFEANDKYPASSPVSTYLEDGSKVNWADVDWSVGNGSTAKVGGFIRPYYVAAAGGLGVTLRLAAVKVYKLEKYQSGGGDSFGFGGGSETSEVAVVEDADF